MSTEVLTSQSCYHCGEACEDNPIYIEDKPFCCSGCKMVYEILNDHDLNNYYCLEEKPGVSLKRQNKNQRFEFLDDENVIGQIADFRNNGFISVSFYIPNIHCTSCIWLLENLYKLNDGITKSSVNFLKRELSVSIDESETSIRSIVELLSSIGYEPELNLEKLDGNKKSTPDRRLWLKMGVAGFAFGNIMLFSFPEYLSGSTINGDGKFHIVFGALNILLGLPVLLYSARDYLKSAWAVIKQGGINLDVPISIGILALFTRSVYEIVSGTGAGYMDSFTGLVFFLLIGQMIQKKTYDRLSFDRDYRSYLPISITVIGDNGTERSLSIDKLVKGMNIRVHNEELIPADAELLSENSFVDYSFITGESDPVEIKKGETVYAGGRIIGPSAEMSIRKEVSNSYLTKLWNNAAFDDQRTEGKVSSLADRLSPHFTIGVIGIALAAGIMWWSVSPEMGLTVATAVLIIACPCALALSTPFTLGSALNILSKNGFYIKGLDVVENLSRATSVVFDKTGTLTKSDGAEISFQGDLADEEEALVKSACSQSMHPLSQKIARFLSGHTGKNVEEYNEIINKGITAEVNGHKLIIGSISFLKERLDLDALAKTNLGQTSSLVYVAIDGEVKGYFAISSSYRPGSEELVSNFRKRFSTYLITGDNDSQKKQLSEIFDPQSLKFNQTPQQKLDFIKKRQDNDERIIMIGDGLNDAGALKMSDFGIALTDDVSTFTPACDAILDGKALNKMNTFIDFSQSSMKIIKRSFGLSILYNTVGLGFAVAGQLSPLVAAILMPLSSISIMAFTTLSTHFTAKKMGLLTWK